MTRLVRLYPQAWRDRYEDEFLALLEERPPKPGDRLDIVRGALDARLHPQTARAIDAKVAPPLTSPLSGVLVATGGVLWLVAVFIIMTAQMNPPTEESGMQAQGSIPFIILSVLALAWGNGLALSGLDSLGGRALRVGICVFAACIPAFYVLPWALMPIALLLGAGLFVVGGVLLVVAAERAGRLARWSAAALTLATASCIAVFGALATLASSEWIVAHNAFVWLALGGPIGITWTVIGISLYRRSEPAHQPVEVQAA